MLNPEQSLTSTGTQGQCVGPGGWQHRDPGHSVETPALRPALRSSHPLPLAIHSQGAHKIEFQV